MARTPDPKVHALWRDRVLRQEASGLTIVKFCARKASPDRNSTPGSDDSGSWKHRLSARHCPPRRLSFL